MYKSRDEGNFKKCRVEGTTESSKDNKTINIPRSSLNIFLGIYYDFCNFKNFIKEYKSRDNSVGIALGYGLDDRGSTVRFTAGAGNFSLRHRVQNGSEAHPISYPLGTRGSFSGGKAARA
jgi:hypothetical protein